MNVLQQYTERALAAGMEETITFGKLCQIARVTPGKLLQIALVAEAWPKKAEDGIFFFEREVADGLLRAVRAVDQAEAESRAGN